MFLTLPYIDQAISLILVFRFWSVFMDWKRGYKEPVESLRQELFAIL